MIKHNNKSLFKSKIHHNVKDKNDFKNNYQNSTAVPSQNNNAIQISEFMLDDQVHLEKDHQNKDINKYENKNKDQQKQNNHNYMNINTQTKNILNFNIQDIRKAKRQTQVLVINLSQKIHYQDQIIQDLQTSLIKKKITIKSQTNLIHDLSMKMRQSQQENQSLRRALQRQKEKNKQLNQDIAYMVRQRIQSQKSYKSKIMELQSESFYKAIKDTSFQYSNEKKRVHYEESTML